MTASRVCRRCGADLAGSVRWCVGCYEPVRELTPREPVWADGEFVDQPIVRSGAVPHWSRWEKSATTFGPAGRISISIVSVLWLLGAAVQNPLTTLFVLPLVVALLRSVWQRGWVVPAHLAAEAPTTPSEPLALAWDRADFWRSVGWGIVALCGLSVFLYVNEPIARFVVLATAVVAGTAWMFRKIDGSR
jgi:hypothetical protein